MPNNVKMVPLSELKPYEKNPRKNERAVPAVMESIRQFGFRQPILIDSKGVIVAGHTRYLAAQRLEMNEVPCIQIDDLTSAQIKAFRIADNKTAERAMWDFDLLTEEMTGLKDDFDMSDFGFTSSEMDFLIGDLIEAEEPAPDPAQEIKERIKQPFLNYQDTKDVYDENTIGRRTSPEMTTKGTDYAERMMNCSRVIIEYDKADEQKVLKLLGVEKMKPVFRLDELTNESNER